MAAWCLVCVPSSFHFPGSRFVNIQQRPKPSSTDPWLPPAKNWWPGEEERKILEIVNLRTAFSSPALCFGESSAYTFAGYYQKEQRACILYISLLKLDWTGYSVAWWRRLVMSEDDGRKVSFWSKIYILMGRAIYCNNEKHWKLFSPETNTAQSLTLYPLKSHKCLEQSEGPVHRSRRSPSKFSNSFSLQSSRMALPCILGL